MTLQRSTDCIPFTRRPPEKVPQRCHHRMTGRISRKLSVTSTTSRVKKRLRLQRCKPTGSTSRRRRSFTGTCLSCLRFNGASRSFVLRERTLLLKRPPRISSEQSQLAVFRCPMRSRAIRKRRRRARKSSSMARLSLDFGDTRKSASDGRWERGLPSTADASL